MFNFSTTTFPTPGSTESTFPDLPRSRPAITTTTSPLRIRFFFNACFCIPSSPPSLQHFRRKGNNLHKFLPSEFTSNRPKDTGPNGIPILIDQDTGIPIKLDVGTIFSSHLLGCSHDHGTAHIALLDRCRGNGFFDSHYHNVSERGIATSGSTQYMKTHGLFGTRVIGHVHVCIALNHS